MEERIFIQPYLKLFVETAWSVYYCCKDRDYKDKTASEIAEMIKGDIGDIIEQNGYKVPYITDMVKELQLTNPQIEDFSDCKEKNGFVDKYSLILSARLQKEKP